MPGTNGSLLFCVKARFPRIRLFDETALVGIERRTCHETMDLLLDIALFMPVIEHVLVLYLTLALWISFYLFPNSVTTVKIGIFLMVQFGTLKPP